MQSTSVEEVSCDADDSSDHSVWFQFMLPFGAVVDIDAGGSHFSTGSSTNSQVVMTLYSQSGLGRIETECLFEDKPRMIDVGLGAGMYFIRLASDYEGSLSLQAPSQYRISIRIRSASQILADPEFGASPGTVWKIKKAGEPPQIAPACTTYCYMAFNGIAGGKLQQTLSIDPRVMKFKVGDYFRAQAYINSTPPAGSNVKLTVKLNYTDGTPPTKVSLTQHIVQTATNANFSSVGGFVIEIKSKALKSIKYMVVSPTAADTFRVIWPVVSLSAGTSVRGVLPLPAQP